MKNNFNQKKINRHIEYIDNKINEYHTQLDQEDNVDTRTEIESKIAYQKQKKENYEALGKELGDSGQTQISKTDKDARAVVLHRNIVNVGYNVQAGCDSKHKLFVNAQTGDVNDTHALADMAIEAKELLDLDKMKTLTDKGYTTGAEIAKCEKNGITTYSSPKEHSSQKNGLYSMNIFEYNKINDTYTCPDGQTMNTNGTTYNKGNHKVKHYKTKACKNCPVRGLCTTNKNGRFIERGIYQETLENNENRVNQNPDYYRLRQQITEHQFGTLKRQWGFTYTLMKEKQNVLSEAYLFFSVYNLIRTLKILGPEKLKNRLKGLFHTVLTKIATYCDLLRPQNNLSTYTII